MKKPFVLLAIVFMTVLASCQPSPKASANDKVDSLTDTDVTPASGDSWRNPKTLSESVLVIPDSLASSEQLSLKQSIQSLFAGGKHLEMHGGKLTLLVDADTLKEYGIPSSYLGIIEESIEQTSNSLSEWIEEGTVTPELLDSIFLESFFGGSATVFFNDTISIHHTCMPDSNVAYLGMDYSSRQVEKLFGKRTGYYLNDDPTGDLSTYLFDDGDVMIEVKEGFGLCYFQTTTSRYYVQIGNMILKVGENVSSVQLPQGMVNEAVGDPDLVNIAILTRIELQGYDMVLCVGSEENVITYVHVGIDEGGI